MKKITVLLVDDHQLFREAWAYLFQKDSRFEVIGETSCAETVMQLVDEKSPDIILMDINMSPVDGFELTRRIMETNAAAKIIGISMHNMPAFVRQLLHAGAMGYVTKNTSMNEAILSITEVYNGRKYICREVRDAIALRKLGIIEPSDRINTLSDRELGVIRLIGEGLSSKEIAVRLELSVKTIEAHRYNILRKLNLKNTAALMSYINLHGL